MRGAAAVVPAAERERSGQTRSQVFNSDADLSLCPILLLPVQNCYPFGQSERGYKIPHT